MKSWKENVRIKEDEILPFISLTFLLPFSIIVREVDGRGLLVKDYRLVTKTGVIT